MVSLVILTIVFVLIATRQIGRLRLQIWQIMLGGALAVLLTCQISPPEAIKAINVDVMLFLLGMFIIGQSLDQSGYLAHLAHRYFRRARSLDGLVLLVLFGTGFLSAILMNDTLAIIGTPVMLLLARKSNTPPVILLLSLAFAVTIGSVMSPIGNPQNLLVSSLGGIDNPFITFFKYLFLPTILNLLVAYLLLRLFYRRHFNQSILNHQPESIKDPALANLCRAALLVIIVMIGLKIMAVFILPDFDFRLTYIALAGALPILLLGKRRLQIVKNIDWPTLVFFTAMFILMSSVWNAGIFQDLIDHMNLNVQDSSVIMGISVVLSQFISNVPLVALYLPMLSEGGVEIASLMALAAGSTIAGNLTILGAASNIIIIQNAEHKAQLTITFWQFVRIGAPLTLVNLLIYWLFLQLL